MYISLSTSSGASIGNPSKVRCDRLRATRSPISLVVLLGANREPPELVFPVPYSLCQSNRYVWGTSGAQLGETWASLGLLLTDSPFRRSAGLCLGSCREAILCKRARDYEISTSRPKLKVFVATDVRGVMEV